MLQLKSTRTLRLIKLLINGKDVVCYYDTDLNHYHAFKCNVDLTKEEIDKMKFFCRRECTRKPRCNRSTDVCKTALTDEGKLVFGSGVWKGNTWQFPCPHCNPSLSTNGNGIKHPTLSDFVRDREVFDLKSKRIRYMFEPNDEQGMYIHDKSLDDGDIEFRKYTELKLID